MKYILNPGDYLDVLSFMDLASAKAEYQRCMGQGTFPKLYRVSLSHPGNVMAWDCWTEDLGFFPISRDNLPIKVLDAAK